MDKLPDKLKIAFLDVGQGDTIVISDPTTHEAIVIDCINANAVLDYLTQEKIKYLRGILITHLHSDHFSEVDYLLKRYDLVPGLNECESVGFNQIVDKDKDEYEMLLHDGDEHASYYERLLAKKHWARSSSIRTIRQWCKDDKPRFMNPQVDGVPRPIRFEGDLAQSISLIHPYAIDMPELYTKGLNNTSAVVRISSPHSSVLLTGDLEPAGWKELRKVTNLKSDVLKFPHHGGAWTKQEDIDDLLNIVDPSIVIISVGSKGYDKYKHPNTEVFEALKNRPNIHLLCTQATNQCHSHVMAQQRVVRGLLTMQAAKNGQKLIGSKRGCPCAGTIIIELSTSARVIQPETTFHQGVIIPKFTDHQCLLRPTMTVTIGGKSETLKAHTEE